MGFIEIFALAIALSMDAFAVSICKGLAMKKIDKTKMFIIGLSFGFFQFFMPILGYFICSQFESYIANFGTFIAFGLLIILGVKMILDAFEKEAEKKSKNQKSFFKELFLLSIATSIDALTVGITFAFFSFNIFLGSAIIGLTTFILCVLGVVIGFLCGSKFKKPAEVLGGVILILIGVKILLNYLGVIAF